ncbi:MAG: indole-3-glycerol phosphate synthase TrpC [Tannerella sp.]|jgi:indole-3-glycerol phosphate synthase|nr:indole-3-glycerol phosphate synthase TrpC [Tannerella sp.]
MHNHTDILHTIVVNKRREVAFQKAAVSLETLLSMGGSRLERPTASMRAALAGSPAGIIAEFKRRSPSKGWLHPQARVADVVPAYERCGASACSILTDGDFFGGSFADLQHARALTRLPLLRKDFIVDEYQLFQARVMGADAVLLIASILTRDECSRLARTAHSLEMEVLLEIHDEAELPYLNPHVDMLGVNNRHLGTFDTSVENSFRLADMLRTHAGPPDRAPLLVSESGLSDADTVCRLRRAGFRGFLIGETFMKTPRPGDTLKQFVEQLGAAQIHTVRQ